MKSQKPIQVALGVQSEIAKETMLFEVVAEYTRFGGAYTSGDLHIARAVLLDLADALTAKLKQDAN